MCQLRRGCAYPDCLQCFDFLVKAAVDIIGVEQGVPGDLAQEVPGKVADVIFAEVPLPQDSAWHHRLGVLVATLAEVTAQVLTIA